MGVPDSDKLPDCCLPENICEDPEESKKCNSTLPIPGGGKKTSIFDYFDKNLNSSMEPTFKPSSLLNRWKHTNARDYFDVLYHNYGVPYMARNKYNGFCIWKYNFPEDDIHTKIELKDENIINSISEPNNTFLYSYIKIYIPPEFLINITKLNCMVVYHQLKKELFARGNNLESNYLTIRKVFDIINNTESKYSDNIISSEDKAKFDLNIIKKALSDNNKKYKNELKLNCYARFSPKLCSINNHEEKKEKKICSNLDECSCSLEHPFQLNQKICGHNEYCECSVYNDLINKIKKIEK